MRTRLRDQQHAFPILLKLYLPIATLTLAVAMISLFDNVGIGYFTRDPASLTNSNPFWGVLSNVGILFWCATATICFFGAAFLRALKRDGETSRFLLYAGLLTAFLMLDDLFLFHEVVFPTYVHVGEKLLILIYATIVAAFLWRFRQRLLESDYLLLIVAFALLGFSVMIDRLPENLLGPWEYLLEDGPKLFGIVAWFAYWSHTAWAAILQRIPNR